MTTRRLAVIALVAAVLVQTGFVATYSWLTDGCFCSVTGSPSPPIPPDFVVWFLKVAAMPAGWAAGALPDLLRSVLDPYPLAAEWLIVLLATAVNAAFWTLAIFALLYGLVLLGRIHRGPGVGAAGAGTRRLRLSPWPGRGPGAWWWEG